jgi:hypothetical protein
MKRSSDSGGVEVAKTGVIHRGPEDVTITTNRTMASPEVMRAGILSSDQVRALAG